MGFISLPNTPIKSYVQIFNKHRVLKNDSYPEINEFNFFVRLTFDIKFPKLQFRTYFTFAITRHITLYIISSICYYNKIYLYTYTYIHRFFKNVLPN